MKKQIIVVGFISLICICSCFIISGCGGGESSSAIPQSNSTALETSSIELQISWPGEGEDLSAQLIQPEVTKIQVKITGDNITSPIIVYLEKGATTKLITGLPSGNLQIEFTGLDAQEKILSSRITNVTLSPGQTLPVSVILGVSILTDGFFPSTITIYKGDTIVFVNNDTVTHSFSIPGLFNSGDIAPGGSYSYTFGDNSLPTYTCTREDGKVLITTVVDGAYAPQPTPTSISSGMVIPGTALNSPVLSALVSQYGLTARPLDTLSKTELESVVKNSYAVGIDLSMLYSASAANDAVIQAALRVGTPIVFENISALTSFLAGQQIDPTGDVKNAVASMAAAIGVGVESQVAVVIPSTDPNASVAAEIYCIGAGSMVPYLTAGVLA